MISQATPTGHSYLATFETCPRLFKYVHVEKLSEGVQSNLAIGTAVHAGLHIWDTLVETDPLRSSHALQAALDSLAEQYIELTDPIMATDYTRAIVITEKLLATYCEYYRQEADFETIATEQELDFPLEPNGERYTGRLDRMARSRSDKLLYIVERKTSGEHPNAFFKRFVLDPQLTGYVWLAEQHYKEPIGGVIVDALFKPRLNPPKKDGTQTLSEVPLPRRETFIRTKVEIEEWIEETIEKRRILRDMVNRHKRGESVRWTKREQSCVRYGRTCGFLNVCLQQEAEFVKEQYRRDEPAIV